MSDCCLEYLRWNESETRWELAGVNSMTVGELEWAYIHPGILEWATGPLEPIQQAALERAIRDANRGAQACMVPRSAHRSAVVELVVLVGPRALGQDGRPRRASESDLSLPESLRPLIDPETC